MNFLTEMLDGVEDSPAKTSMVGDHCNVLIKTIGGMQIDLPDATSAMKLVRSNKTILGDTNVEMIRQAITRSSGSGIALSTKKKYACARFARTQLHRGVLDTTTVVTYPVGQPAQPKDDYCS